MWWSSLKVVPKSLMTDKERRHYSYMQLVRLYHADLYRYSCWLCRSADTAQDLVQDTYLRAWKSIDLLQSEASAKAWLFTILRNENARRFERKQFQYQDVEQDLLLDEHQVSPEQLYSQQQLLRQIESLEPEYSEPLILQIIGGFSGDEIAQLLALNLNTVNTRLFRARKQLRDLLNSDNVREQQNG
ncbi:sigma-70 family RNA polymerase sigma factor [Rheinheimera sediminis]|uniref:sigma-70 family RNA polymerase sigma factor n=1 Tax=Rheinheimera sp. YQF-1 TaxID=2499626 RepID=UPI000FDB79F9|nr:sigma-70 family RNA polymerase sigma factor [Rheinheimera sp. YQF-1]RVT46227.1 sigma-70 family RNA polymerase sigma factor [Rheinheimera sp. YQF-1]